MPYVERKRRPYAVLEKVRPWAIGVAIAGVLGVFFGFLATRGPRSPDHAVPVTTAENDPALAGVAAEVNAQEAAWRQAVEKDGESSNAARAALTKAVELQRDFVRSDARASVKESERLRAFEAALDTLQVRDKAARVDVLEREAGVARDGGQVAEAITKLHEALRVQEEINRTRAAASVKDFPRESRLRVEMETLEAEPLSVGAARALEAAEHAVKAERWADARTAYTEARAAQGRINREFGRTRFADRAAEDRMAGEIASLAAAGMAQVVNEKTALAEVATRAGRRDEAAKFFGEAKAAQEDVNVNHPQSRFVSAQRAEELEAYRQTELSAALLKKLLTLDRGIAESLRTKDFKGAQAKIADAATLAAQTWKEFPRSRELDPALRERLDYLATRGAGLEQIQEDVFATLFQLPGASARMLRTETPQSLYARIMDTNPSRQVGEARAVDSVSWGDAQEFCRRLRWVLGRTARLPSEGEFRRAVAEKSSEFADLRGNLAEWLDAPSTDQMAAVAGGSYLNTAGSEAETTFTPMAKTERARHVGFRVVIE